MNFSTMQNPPLIGKFTQFQISIGREAIAVIAERGPKDLVMNCNWHSRRQTKTRSGRAVEPGDVAGAVDVLRDVVIARRQGRRIAEPDRTAVSAFSARETAAQLATCFDALDRSR